MHRYDLHVHTAEGSSCGKVAASELVEKYAGAGYSGLVITDHYYRELFEGFGNRPWREKVGMYLKGYRIAREVGRRFGLNVLPGMEISFDENSNDYLIYGIDEEFLLAHPRLYTLDLKRFAAGYRHRGLLIIQAHPYRAGITRARPELLDGVETFNGNPRHEERNDLAARFARSNGLIAISGSDFHQEEDLARGGVLLPREPSNPRELVEILRRDTFRLIRAG